MRPDFLKKIIISYICIILQNYYYFLKRTICLFLSLMFVLLAHGQDGLRIRTVVIDPGHGGKDPGAVSKDRKTYEKNITLDIASKLAASIREEYPDIKVVMTRSGDTFPELQQRATIANNANADLFISIHINAAANTSASGFSVHVLGQSSNRNRDLYAFNMEICKRENSVIQLEEDFSQNYQGFDPSDPASYIFMSLMQNSNLERSIQFAETIDESLRNGPILKDRGVSQDPFLVLWMTSMPSVLVELGFISNSSDLEVLRNTSKRSDLAKRLFNAFKSYKEAYEVKTERAAVTSAPAADKPEAKPETAGNSHKVEYGVQIIVSSRTLDRNDGIFLGYEPKVYKVGGFNKYIVSVSGNLDEVKKNFSEIKKKNKDCFIVKIEDESRISAY